MNEPDGFAAGPKNCPFVRPVRVSDIDALVSLAAMTGGGMTNLPPDRAALLEKIERSEASLKADVIAPVDEFYLLIMEDADGEVIGTASLFSRLGARWPFYSYKLSRVTHVSRDLGRLFSTHLLNLVNDFDGASEVGGLFLHPGKRGPGVGALLARSRYMFIAQHRERFGALVIADLRGRTVNGTSPFWEAVARPFFGSAFLEADLHNALHGNQFIADLMPRYPIYISMLPAEAREAIARPHTESAPAMRLLEAEGFTHEGYCDIFDAGPTLQARTDLIRTVRDAQRIDGMNDTRLCVSGKPIAATGRLDLFRAWFPVESTEPRNTQEVCDE